MRAGRPVGRELIGPRIGARTQNNESRTESIPKFLYPAHLVRISVLGNSDTVGIHLASPDLAWPALVREQLATDLVEPVEVDSWRFAPYRPEAARYALKLVTEAQPDFVVLPIASYWCAFTTVRQNVERRLGARAAAMFSRAENAYATRVERNDGTPGRGRTFLRKAARKTLGTAPVLTVPAFIEVYSELIRELSRREELQVIVYGDRVFSEALRELMPGIGPVIERVEAALKPLTLERRYLWLDLRTAFPGGQAQLGGDGIHMAPGAHEVIAEALVPLFKS